MNHQARREFLKGMAGITGGIVLLLVGAADKVFRFFFGPRPTKDDDLALMGTRIKRLESATRERQLEMERWSSDYILVAALSDLSTTKGKYFIDYEMQPGLAFASEKGLPILLSAKCTHLGCTVGNDVNDRGQVLCPCHISYFDIKTGEPNPGSPAKTPLPHVSWVLKNKKGELVAKSDSMGELPPTDKLADSLVYITRRQLG